MFYAKFIKTLALLVTRKCNMECDICYIYPEFYSGSENDANNSNTQNLKTNNTLLADTEYELTLNEIHYLLEDATKSGYNRLHIYGGEPFIRSDLEQIVIRARELGYSVDIATNMTLISESDFEWLKNNEVSLAVSVNYWDLLNKDFDDLLHKKNLQKIINEFEGSAQKKEINDERPLIFKQKVEIIEKLIEKDIPIVIISVITKENYKTYEYFVEYMLNKGAKNFWANYFSLLGRGRKKANIALNGFEWNNFITHMENNSQFRRSGISDANLHVEASFLSNDNFVPYQTECYLLNGTKMMVDTNGDVYPCLLFVNQEKWKLGNIRESLFSVISKNLTDKWIEERLKLSEDCQKCEIFESCLGGCPAYLIDGKDYRCKNTVPSIYLACPFIDLF